jgi:hypothetical protein
MPDVWDLADMRVDEVAGLSPPAAPNGPSTRSLPTRDAAQSGGFP